MKKNTNNELKKNVLKGVKDGKKSKDKKVEKHKKEKVKNVEVNNAEVKEIIKDDLVKVIDAVKATKKEKTPTVNGKEHEELSEAEIAAKIAKKKAKKLAQKLKKKEKKALESTEIKEKVEPKLKQNKGQNNKNVKVVSKALEETDTAKTTKSKQEKKDKKAEKKRKLKEEKDNNVSDEPRHTSSEMKGATIFVGNLPVNTKRIQLVRLFKDYTPVVAIRMCTAGGNTIFKHKQRREAGALNAYIVFKDVETAKRATALNGSQFKENHLRVNMADKASADTDSKCVVFVGNLKYSATEDKLREIFSSCGELEYVRCLQDGDKGCKGVAYVCFKAAEAVGLALELNETLLDDRPMHVERYSVKKLGAKQTRDASAASKKPATGAKKRSDDKKKKNNRTTDKKSNEENGDKKKKSEFRGVKVDAIKKKEKKKKPSSQMQQLAKKIAPKSE